MNTFTISFIIYWAIGLALSIAVYYGLKKQYNLSGFSLWKKSLVLLVASLVYPLVIIWIIIDIKWGKKKPEPINRDLLSIMEFDMVKDDGKYITLRKYNEIHGTSYSLKDVYGEEYAEKHHYEEHKDDIDYQPKLPEMLGMPITLKNTPAELACEALGNAIVHGMFKEFEEMLDENAETILYESRTISGKNNVLDYWKGWKKKYFDNGQTKDPKLIRSEYNNDIALSLDTMLVYAYVEEKKIKKLLLIRHHISPYIGFRDDMTKATPSIEDIKDGFEPIPSGTELESNFSSDNRIPCLQCGSASDSLEWHMHRTEAGTVGYLSYVSVCPHCQKVVEFKSEVRYRF